MAIEYIEVTEGSGSKVAVDTVDTDKQVQMVKLMLGADGAADNLVDAGAQLSAASVPVVLASDHADVPVTLDSEEVTVNLGATDNAVLDDIAAKLSTIDADTSHLDGCIDRGGGNINLLVVHDSVLAQMVKTEDHASSHEDLGIPIWAIRDDTLAAASGTEGDYEPLHTNNNGALYAETVPGTMWTANGDYTEAQTNTSLKAAAASNSHYLTDLIITNDGTAAITAKLLDGSGGTNKTGTHKIPASGGIVINFRTPIKFTSNTAICLTTTGTSNFSVLANGYTAP